jgi:hypothetical protein
MIVPMSKAIVVVLQRFWLLAIRSMVQLRKLQSYMNQIVETNLIA